MRAIGRALAQFGSLLLAAAVASAEDRLPVEARDRIAAEDWPAAAKLLEPLAKDPSNEPANFWLGMAHWSAGKPNEAAPRFAAALKANPLYRPTAVMLARCARACRDPGMGEAAERAFPADPDILHCLGRAWMPRYFSEKDRWAGTPYAGREKDKEYLAKATSYFERAERLSDEEMPENDRWLAFACLYGDRYDKAVEHGMKAVAAGHESWDTLAVIGEALEELGRHDEAAAAYARAKRLGPQHRDGLEYVEGLALHRAGRWGEATVLLCELARRSPKSYFVRGWLGSAALDAGRLRLAMWALAESWRLDHGDGDIFRGARVALEMGRPALAEKMLLADDERLRKANRKPGADREFHLALARWSQGKDKEQAAKDMRAAFDRSPGDAESARSLLRALMENDDPHGMMDVCREMGKVGRADEAIRIIEEIVLKRWPQRRPQDFFQRKPPHDVYAHRVIGDILYEEGRFHSALAHYQKGNLTTFAIPFAVAWSYGHAGRLDDAEKAFPICANSLKPEQKYFAWIGEGWVHVQKGDGAKAKALFARVSEDAVARDSGLLAAAMASRDAAGAKAVLDPYTMLGMLRARWKGKDRGEEVRAVLKGGLLDAADPPIRTRDVLLRVGDSPLGANDQLKAFRGSPMPAAPVEALLARDGAWFRVKLDYPGMLARLREMGVEPPARPEPKEKR